MFAPFIVIEKLIILAKALSDNFLYRDTAKWRAKIHFPLYLFFLWRRREEVKGHCHSIGIHN